MIVHLADPPKEQGSNKKQSPEVDETRRYILGGLGSAITLGLGYSIVKKIPDYFGSTQQKDNWPESLKKIELNLVNGELYGEDSGTVFRFYKSKAEEKSGAIGLIARTWLSHVNDSGIVHVDAKRLEEDKSIINLLDKTTKIYIRLKENPDVLNVKERETKTLTYDKRYVSESIFVRKGTESLVPVPTSFKSLDEVVRH